MTSRNFGSLLIPPFTIVTLFVLRVFYSRHKNLDTPPPKSVTLYMDEPLFVFFCVEIEYVDIIINKYLW